MSRVIHQLTIAIAVVLANSVVAQSSDVVLHLVYEVTGEKRALLRMPSSVADRYAFAGAVAGVLGIEESAVTDGEDPEAKSSDRGLHGVGRVPEHDALVFADQLDLNSFHAPLVAAGFTSMRLTVRLPNSPQSGLDQHAGGGLFGTVTYSDSIEADQLGMLRHVRFGWRALDIWALILRILVLAGLGFIALQQLKRLAIATTEREPWRRPYAIVKFQARGLAALLILWSIYVAFWATPFPLVYAWPVLVSWSPAVCLVLIVVPGMALSSWVHRGLHSMTRNEPYANWNRRELAIYGSVMGAGIQFAFGVPLLLTSHAFAQLPEPGSGVILAFIALLVLVPGAALLMNSRFMGVENRVEEHGPVAESFSELAQIIGLRKVPPLGIAWYTRGYLANAFDLTRLLTPNALHFSSARNLDARLLTECAPRELDSILARLLIRQRRRHSDRLQAIRIYHLFFGGAAVLGTLFYTVEYDLWGLSSSTRIVPLLCLCFGVGALCSLLYWLHYAWTSRRYVLREDQAVLALLDAPTEQVRGIIREEMLAFVPLERAWCWWLSTVVCPHDRARRLGLSAEEDWDAIRQEILHQTESGAVSSVSPPIAGLSHAMTTQVILAMMVTFPVLALLPAIIALAFRLLPTDVVPLWCMALLGGAICAAPLALLDNFIAPLGYRSLRRHLMEHPSASAPKTPAFLVVHRPRTRNESWHPSAGVVEIRDSELAFQDNVMVLEVPWHAVESLSFETLGFYGIPRMEVCVEWRDDVEGDWRASNFLPFSGTTGLSFNREALRLLVCVAQNCKPGVFKNGRLTIQKPSEKPKSVVSKLASLASNILLLLVGISGCSFFTFLGSAVLEKAIYGKIGTLPYVACAILVCTLAANAAFGRLFLWRLNSLAQDALRNSTHRIEY